MRNGKWGHLWENENSFNCILIIFTTQTTITILHYDNSTAK